MIPLRLVIDTNVIVSAAIMPEGLQRTVVNIALAKPCRFYVSESILEEYKKVIARPHLKIDRSSRRRLLDLIADRSHLVEPTRLPVVTSDPDDNKFVECADAARADYLLTGNQRHFPTHWKCTKIITSRQFIEIVAPHLIS